MANIAYFRVSTQDQSTESQLHSMQTSGLCIDKSFSDENVSGSTKATDRVGFSEMLKYIREGDTVYVAAIDRLGRNTLDVLSTVEHIKSKGVKLVSLRENFDLSSPMGQAMLTMLAAVAQLERDNINARRIAGMERAKASGKHMGRVADSERNEKIQRLFADGMPKAAIAKELGCSRQQVYNVLSGIK
ncbi:recombinase family protein [Serratia marcescens]|uniref:recombinase family protein n=1 Tax=Serratia TaxID=613 RepID=UPI002FDB2AD8